MMWRAGHGPQLESSSSFVVAFAAPDAEAVPCGARCYGIASWDPAHLNEGLKATVNVDCLHVNNTSNNFITFEAWLGKNGYWVEEGMAHGNPRTDRYWFWADFRPGWGYSEHDRPDLPHALGTDYTIGLWKHGVADTSWYVYQNSSYVGTSTDNFGGSSNRTDSGSETVYMSTNTRTNGRAKELQWRGGQGSWNDGWDHANVGHAELVKQADYTASWVNQYTHAIIKLHPNDC